MVAAGIVVALAVAGLFLARPPLVASVDYRVCDLLTAWAGGGRLSGRVAVVEIDEKSVARFGRWPWPRAQLGSLVRRVLEAGAATVVLDVMFPEEDRGPAERGMTNNAALASAMAGHPAVIGYGFSFAVGQPGDPGCELAALSIPVIGPRPAELFRASGVVCSVAALSRAAAGAGFLNSAPESDGKLRRIPLLIEYNGQQYPSLALAAVAVYQRPSSLLLFTDTRGPSQLGPNDKLIPVEGPALMRLRFRGRQRTFPYISAADVMDERVPTEKLRGKIAVIGGTASGIENQLPTPEDPLFLGVEVQATAIDNLLQGDVWSKPADLPAWEFLLLLAAGLASTLLLALIRSLWGALTTLALIALAWTCSLLLLSNTGMLLSPLPVTAVIAGNYSVLTLLNYVLEKRRADQTEQQLISAREYTVAALAESEERYRRLVENINNAIIVDDLLGRLVFASRRFREWFGLGDREIRGVLLEDHVAPEWRDAVRDLHSRRVRGETAPDHFEYEGIRPDGTRIWIEALVTTVQDEGRVTGTQSALRDISQRKRIEAEYLQAQKMESVGRLAGGVAHDFNNLLTVINGYSSMTLSLLPEQDPSREYVTEILAAGERAAELTQKLLAFSRRQAAHVRSLNLNRIVADAEKMLQRVIGEDIALITRLSPDTGQVICDPGQMHQVLMNLVVNSRDSMPHGGTLIVETKNVEVNESSLADHPGVTCGSYVYLGVTDTGIGMSEEVQRHIFEPFFTTKDPNKGTGLGLTTVYGIVSQSGGYIRVQSALNRGTTFHIYLPRTDEKTGVESATGAVSAAPHGSETVLIVEDEDAVRKLGVTVLERYGYRVLQASSGPEAIKLAAEYPARIHLLLTDVVLPQMNGRALADALKIMRPEMKVLYISGYSEEIIADQGVPEAGATCVPKPFEPDVLAGKVRETLSEGQGDAGAFPRASA